MSDIKVISEYHHAGIMLALIIVARFPTMTKLYPIE